ncbi:MAG: Lrp/AsnC family transcriptional regulator [Candidatus Aenigmarchaeota archaeon]|nr:Lrp/AsnC family transcriptional regulator [Candidatus Aenigmarchaeota archaeon]
MKKETLRMDEKDKKILQMLKSDCKMPVKNISKAINSPVTTVYSKIKKMEKTGVIKGYKAVLDNKKLGSAVTAFVCVSLMPSHVRCSSCNKELRNEIKTDVTEELKKLPEVECIYMVTGPWDIIMQLKSESVESVGELITKKIRSISGIMNTLTLMSVKEVKG